MSFNAKKVPKRTPLKDSDLEKRLAYAQNGPILNGGTFGIVTLPDDWEERKKKICFLDHA